MKAQGMLWLTGPADGSEKRSKVSGAFARLRSMFLSFSIFFFVPFSVFRIISKASWGRANNFPGNTYTSKVFVQRGGEWHQFHASFFQISYSGVIFYKTHPPPAEVWQFLREPFLPFF